MIRFGVGVSPLSRQAGFAGNPFRALSDSEWTEVAILPPPLRAYLQSDDTGHLQLLGATGRGKSSALRATMREARRRGILTAFEYLPLGVESLMTDIPDGCWFCLDEAQRLNPRERTRLITTVEARKARIFLGSHEDLTPLFEFHRLPLSTVTLDALDGVHFNAVLRNRLRYFAMPNGGHATLSEDALLYLRDRFGSDLRQTERFLYDVFQRSVRSPVPISADLLRRES